MGHVNPFTGLSFCTESELAYLKIMSIKERPRGSGASGVDEGKEGPGAQEMR